MVHVRQHLVNPYGEKITKIKTVKGELGSGVHDTNGKEIFVGDIIEGTCVNYAGAFAVKGLVDFGPNGFYVTELDTDNVYGLTELLPATVVGQKDRL